MDSIKANYRWRDLLSRGGLFIVIWWILSDGAAQSWLVGLPAVLLALMASIALIPSAHFIWYEFLKFLPFFFLNSLLGGIDVARRAFQPHLPIDPALIEYRLQLRPGPPQVLVILIINLLPGTLVAGLEGNVIKVHVLDGKKDYREELVAIEQGVARMFDNTRR